VTDQDWVNEQESLGEYDGVGRDRVYVTVGADSVAETVGGESVAVALEEVVSVRVEVVVASRVREELWVREGSERLQVTERVTLGRDGETVRLRDSEWWRDAETEVDRVREKERVRDCDGVSELDWLREGDRDGPVWDWEAEGLLDADRLRDWLRLLDRVRVSVHEALPL